MKGHVFFIAIAMIMLTGCFDRIELEQQSYVIAVGIDKTEEEGQYNYTYQIANPAVGSAAVQSGPNEPPAEIVTVKGSDILGATNTANSFVSKKITLDHTKIIVISEELARSKDFLGIIQSGSRTPQIRRGVELVVSKESASDFINNNQPIMEQRPHKYYQFMLSRAKQTGIIPNATLHRFFQITEGDADLFLGIYATTMQSDQKDNGEQDQYIAGEIPQRGGSPTQFMGSAVFKEGQMIDTLTGEETRFSHILDKTMDMKDFLATMPDPVKPDFRITYDYSQKQSPQIDFTYHKNKPSTIKVEIPFQIEVIAIPSLVDYSQNRKGRQKLRKAIIQRFEEKTSAFIEQSQTQYRSDPFYWSLYARPHFKNIKAYEKADWHKKIYPNAEVSVTYKMDKLEFGKMINDSKINEVRD